MSLSASSCSPVPLHDASIFQMHRQAVVASQDAPVASAPFTPTRDASRSADAHGSTPSSSAQQLVGRHVCVPASLWPSYPCDELDGRGWEGVVEAFEPPFAVVSFSFAVDPQGLPYEAVKLRPSVLQFLD